MTDKKYEEVEIIGKFKEKSTGNNFSEEKKEINDDYFDIKNGSFSADSLKDKIEEGKKDLKKKLFLKLLPYFLFSLFLIIAIFWIIFIIFDNPFDYIFAGILAFSIIRIILKIGRFIK